MAYSAPVKREAPKAVVRHLYRDKSGYYARMAVGPNGVKPRGPLRREN